MSEVRPLQRDFLRHEVSIANALKLLTVRVSQCKVIKSCHNCWLVLPHKLYFVF